MAIKRTILLLILLLAFLPVSSQAEDKGSTVDKQKEQVGRVTLESREYPLDHYKLEANIGDGFKDTGDRALHGINQGLWGFNKTIASFSDYAVGELMSFDLISTVASQAGEMSKRIYEIMTGTFLSLFIVITGGTAAWRFYVKQQSAQAVKALLGALAIMAATFWFYSDTSANIQQLNKWGSEIEGVASSANVLMTSESFDSSKAFDAKEGVAVLQNQMFNLMVKRPYLLLNYGTTKESEVIKEDPNRVDNLLSIKPFVEEGNVKREKIVKDEVENLDNKQMSPEFSGERFGYLIITIVSTIALSVPILILASFKFLLQVWFLALVIFTAVPLIISLIPSYSETALNHFKKICGVLLMKGGLVLLIGVITGLITLLYDTVKVTNGLEGYVFVVFMIVIIVWGLLKYRSEIFEVASAGVVQGQQMAERMTYATAGRLGDAGEKGYEGVKRVTKGAFIFGGKTRGMLSGKEDEGGRSELGSAVGDAPSPVSSRRAGYVQTSGQQSRYRLASTNVQGTGTKRKDMAKQSSMDGVVPIEFYKQEKEKDPGKKKGSEPVSKPSRQPINYSGPSFSEFRNPVRTSSEVTSLKNNRRDADQESTNEPPKLRATQTISRSQPSEQRHPKRLSSDLETAASNDPGIPIIQWDKSENDLPRKNASSASSDIPQRSESRDPKAEGGIPKIKRVKRMAKMTVKDKENDSQE